MSEVAVTSVSADDIARTSSGIELVLYGFCNVFQNSSDDPERR